MEESEVTHSIKRTSVGSGAPGKPKSEEHRKKIAEGVSSFWKSPEGRAVREAQRVAGNAARQAAREEATRTAMEASNGR